MVHPVGVTGRDFVGKEFYVQHINDELRRITARLQAVPEPFEHAGLYAAQQALSWAAQPDAFKAPYDLIVGSAAGTKGCCTDKSQPAFSGTDVSIRGVQQQR